MSCSLVSEQGTGPLTFPDFSRCRRLTARLARTEEAAKRVIMLRDPTARGPAAARLLDAERALSVAEAERTEMQAAPSLPALRCLLRSSAS